MDKARRGRPVTTGGKNITLCLPPDIKEWLRGHDDSMSMTVTKLVNDVRKPDMPRCACYGCNAPALVDDLLCDYHRGMETDADDRNGEEASLRRGGA